MLTSLRCQNFRCFADTGHIELAPLTLLVGENNSGKSSIIQALHILALTRQSEDPGIYLLLQHEDYDYGSYEDLVFRHESTRSVDLTIGVVEDRMEYRLPAGLKQLRGSVQLIYSYLPKRKEVYLSRMVLRDEHQSAEDSGRWEVSQRAYRRSPHMQVNIRGHEYDASYISRLFVRNQSTLVPKVGPYECYERLKSHYDKDEETKRVLVELFFGINLMGAFERSLKLVRHLGPLRLAPKRMYSYSGEIADWVGTKGERAPGIFSALLKQATEESKTRVERITKALCQLRFIKSFSAQHYPRHYELWTEHNESGMKANLADTGFGASQVFPVIVSLVTSRPGSTLLYEQPEIHLHPAAQAELGSVFAEACSDDKRVIVETHSENLILRVQREVAQGTLTPEQVRIYYVKPDPDGHQVMHIPLDKKGAFLEKWPKGFFEEAYRESVELSRARRGA